MLVKKYVRFAAVCLIVFLMSYCYLRWRNYNNSDEHSLCQKLALSGVYIFSDSALRGDTWRVGIPRFYESPVSLGFDRASCVPDYTELILEALRTFKDIQSITVYDHFWVKDDIHPRDCETFSKVDLIRIQTEFPHLIIIEDVKR